MWRQQQQQSNPIIPSHLPSQIFAPERLSELLTHGSYDNTKHKAVKKPTKKIIKYTTTTTTTRPPIVWFPGDPDCNDAATSSKNLIPFARKVIARPKNKMYSKGQISQP